MNKKSQITIFVILGIILVIIFFLFLKTKPEEQQKIITDYSNIYYQINICTEESLKNAINNYTIITPEKIFFESKNDHIYVISKNNVNFFPEKETIKQQILKNSNRQFISCLNSIKHIYHFSFDISNEDLIISNNIIKYSFYISLNFIDRDEKIHNKKINFILNTFFGRDMDLLKEFSLTQSNKKLFDLRNIAEINFITRSDYFLYFEDDFFIINFKFKDENMNIDRGVWFAVK